jgi:hypothetical protein
LAFRKLYLSYPKRDLLLPMLMNGQVTVRRSDKRFSDVKRRKLKRVVEAFKYPLMSRPDISGYVSGHCPAGH